LCYDMSGLCFHRGRHGKTVDVLEPGPAFIYKPFTVEELSRKLREVLDGPADNGKRNHLFI